MHFSHINNGSGSRLGKIAIVAAMHVAVGALVMKSIDDKAFTMPKIPDEIVLMLTQEPPPPPPPPPEPAEPMPKTAPPRVTVPPVEVAVEPPPTTETIRAEVVADPQPAPSTPAAPAQPDAAPASSGNPAAGMRTAVFADANGCAKPDYPAKAARNGETGTVSLALLVGADGRVADARVQKSSGSRELDRAAVSALSLCKFVPATSGGVAEQAWARIAYVWTLE